jgi:DNA primase
MAKFPEYFVQQVAQATDIVDLVGRYVALKKRGREFIGLCPFHDDKNPSMYVSPVKQIFKCFACGAGGGVYQFLMLHDKLTFPEAVRDLAERANIPLPRDASDPAPSGPSKTDLVSVMTFAARFFREQLRGPAGKDALAYARDRGLSEESIERFGLGFAPESWDALINAAGRNNIGPEPLEAAGLVIRRETGGCYDRFRNRLIFPIIDVQGRVIAFGGRALAADERAKYLNSPETPLFDKSSQLYGLNWAREAIASGHTAVVVEGYLDVLMPHQFGVSNVVATLGTSLAERHVRLLGRYAREVVLVYDADVAGAAAAERALEMFLAQRLHVRVATIPAGKDPCDYVLAEGPEALSKLIAEAPDALTYAWQRRSEQIRDAGDSLAARGQVIEEFLSLVVNSSAYGAIDEVRRGQLAQHIAHMLNIPSADLQQQMRRMTRRISRASQVSRLESQVTEAAGGTLPERQLLEVLLNRPELFDNVMERVDPTDFSDPHLRALARVMWPLGMDGRLSIEELVAREDLAELAGLVAELAAEGERRGNDEQTLTGAVEHLLYRRSRQHMQELRVAADDDEALRTLSSQLRSPDPRRLPRIR